MVAHRRFEFWVVVFNALLGIGWVRAQSAAEGFHLLGERNCTACHAAPDPALAWIHPKAAPRLADVAQRVDPGWIERFVADPSGTHPGTTMPDVLATLPPDERAASAQALAHHFAASAPGRFQRRLPDRAAVARGDALFHQVGCVACHAPQAKTNAVKAAVGFPDLAAKWSLDGLRQFLRDPLAVRPAGRMPSLGLNDAEASDLAQFLLRETRVPSPLEFTQFRGHIEALEDLDAAEVVRTGAAAGFSLAEAGRDRRQALRFSGWLDVRVRGLHVFHLAADGASRIAVDEQWLLGADSWQTEKVDGKATLRLDPGWHAITVDYVHRGPKEPRLVVEWEEPGGQRGPIPSDRLNREASRPEPLPAFQVDATLAATGRSLYERWHCAACHDSKPPPPHAPNLASVNPGRGCLAEATASTPAVPRHHLSPTELASIRLALAKLATPNPAPPTARERVGQTLATFRCLACHRRDGDGGVTPDRDVFFTSSGEDLGDEGRIPPDLSGVGDRLQPSWLRRVLAEGSPVRPYLRTRMPRFGESNVAHLATLLVELDRRPEPIPPVADSVDAQREAGRTLVGTDGLSCIACHRFNRQPAHQMQVADLGTVAQRLNPDWFRRFLRDPNRYHPGTRMPSFWPDGADALPTVLDGKMHRQQAALWTYLADGPNAKFPEGLSRQNVELIVGGEAVVYRGKLWEAGFRAIATGYPGQLNAAFDAEELRLALLWRGRFLNAGPHWTIQGMGRIRPLGTEVVTLPHGPALAVLTSPEAAWPTNAARENGLKFRGYQLDPQRQPILLYDVKGSRVEDLVEPLTTIDRPGLRRTLKFTGPVPSGLHLRLAQGGAIAANGPAWKIAAGMEVRFATVATPVVRGTGAARELLLPIQTPSLQIDYVWTNR